MESSKGKIVITPKAPMFQWWDFVPHYTFKEYWDRAPLSLDLSEVRAIYKRGPVYLLACQRGDVKYVLYLAQVPEGLSHHKIQEAGPIEVVKLLRQFPSKWKRLFPRFLILAFVTIIMVRMFVTLWF